MNFMITILITMLFCSFTAMSQVESPSKTPEKKIELNKKIIFEEDPKGIDTLFKNMVVIQKKAVERKGKIVFDSHLSFDFSDNPKTMYAASFGLGYALSETVEFGMSFTPFFMSNERSSVESVRGLTLEDGNKADLVSPDPKWEAAGHILWSFAYGKDAFGPFSIIRSDTFFKAFASKIQYAEGLSGNRMGLLVGKTFFVSKAFNFRIAVGFAKQDTFINLKPQSTLVGLIEPGLVWFF